MTPVSTGPLPPPDAPAGVEDDPRFSQGVALFDQGSWYACHDVWEDLWMETMGPERPALQGLLQIAVAQLHLERDNRKGATILLGEGLGRLARFDDHVFGLRLGPLRRTLQQRLRDLQHGLDGADAPLPPLGGSD